ncbi:MAG: YdcF family protein [Clostridia bacterium]|nr:YdcF family protein [Clostridia bacterium]
MIYKKSKKAWAWLIFGCLFLGYYLIELPIIGTAFNSLLWCWGVGGAICLLFAALTFHFGRISIPRGLFVAVCVIVALIFAFFCFIEILIISHMGEKGEENLDYIIVLGAKVNKNEVPSKPLYWRIEKAAEYLEKNPQTRAILSGGKGADEPISEAECMFRELVKRNIPAERLILESEATDTNENIRFSLNLMEEDARFGVISNNFHIYRAVQISEKISGKDVSGIAANYIDPLLIHYMAREAVGIFVDVLCGNMDF